VPALFVLLSDSFTFCLFNFPSYCSIIEREAYFDCISTRHLWRIKIQFGILQDKYPMPFFNKKPQAADANTATAVGSNNASASEKPGLKGLMSRRNRQPVQPTQEQAAYGHDNLNRRPTFGQWLKGTIVDIITMVIMGVIGLGVSVAFIST